jgi:large-conductance mechanosensitive channel
MIHWMHEQLINFNVIAFVLICVFVIVIGKANMKKELKKMHEDLELEHEKVMDELNKMHEEIQYILGRMER